MSERPPDPDFELHGSANDEVERQLGRFEQQLGQLARQAAWENRTAPTWARHVVLGKHVRQAADHLLHEPSDEVFISYADDDRVLAGVIYRFLKRDNDVPCFMAGRSIKAGSNWLPAIFRHLLPCRLLVFLATPRSLASKWCFAELALAAGLKKPLLVARQQAKDGDLPAFIPTQTLPFETSAQQKRFLARVLAVYRDPSRLV